MKILILSILVLAFVFLMLYLSGESKDDFPFGEEPEEADEPTTQDWDNETTGY